MYVNLFLNGIKKERDPIFSDLEESVFSKIKELSIDNEPIRIKPHNKFVSFEEAIRELSEMRKKF
jgi:hypothetical protein